MAKAANDEDTDCNRCHGARYRGVRAVRSGTTAAAADEHRRTGIANPTTPPTGPHLG
jgi:hypothetical protein